MRELSSHGPVCPHRVCPPSLRDSWFCGRSLCAVAPVLCGGHRVTGEYCLLTIGTHGFSLYSTGADSMVFVPSLHHRDMQDKQCHNTSHHHAESVGSDLHDALTGRVCGLVHISIGTILVLFLRVLAWEHRRNGHGGEFLPEDDYSKSKSSTGGSANAITSIKDRAEGLF